ncbi:MAG: rhomboid family intramembrane serine protease [Flavobacteriaceae bacterium]|nr:rhomboid family intramembrane serine protease [Flavobacteriaceae bacterium]
MNQFKLKFQLFNAAEKLITVLVLFYLISTVVSVLFQFNAVQFLELESDLGRLIYKPWTLMTYALVHQGIFHILFNMLWLHFSSRLFLNLFDDKRFYALFSIGVLLGAAFFLIAYNTFPALSSRNAMLVGSSAGVTAILIFMCVYAPQTGLRFFTFNLKLWQLGVFFVVLDVLQLGSGVNIGGHLAHLGGALSGYFLAYRIKNASDDLMRFSDFWIKVFEPLGSILRPKKRAFKKVYKNTNKSADRQVHNDQVKLDSILDKISKSGYEALSAEEKDFLFQQSKK